MVVKVGGRVCQTEEGKIFVWSLHAVQAANMPDTFSPSNANYLPLPPRPRVIWLHLCLWSRTVPLSHFSHTGMLSWAWIPCFFLPLRFCTWCFFCPESSSPNSVKCLAPSPLGLNLNVTASERTFPQTQITNSPGVATVHITYALSYHPVLPAFRPSSSSASSSFFSIVLNINDPACLVALFIGGFLLGMHVLWEQRLACFLLCIFSSAENNTWLIKVGQYF